MFSTNPFQRATPAVLIVICAPLQKRSTAMRGSAPCLKSAVVKLPIMSDFGAKVFTIAPRSRKTTMSPPGTFCIVLRIGTLPPIVCTFLLKSHLG